MKKDVRSRSLKRGQLVGHVRLCKRLVGTPEQQSKMSDAEDTAEIETSNDLSEEQQSKLIQYQVHEQVLTI